ncbi:MAG: hypothetical protein LBP89_10565 [Helicobacteraceae bacterium]|nr:hypothetical protein [Helicobacteraceae bacterium]
MIFIRPDKDAGKAKKIIYCAPIYRIMRFKELEDIGKGKLTLKNPKCWEPFEGIILKELAKHPNDIIQARVKDRNRYYAQCWSFDNNCEALWRLYSREEKEGSGIFNGVQVKTTLGRLWSAIVQSKSFNEDELFIGKVEYTSKNKLINRFKKKEENYTFSENGYTTTMKGTRNLTEYKSSKFGKGSSFFIKLNSFNYEKEARLIVYDDKDDKKDPKDPFYLYIDNPIALCEEIVIDARTSDEDYKNKEERIKDLGYKGVIKKCHIYDHSDFDQQIEKDRRSNLISQGGEDEV